MSESIFDLIARIRVETDEFEQGLDSAQSQAEEFASNMEDLDSATEQASNGMGTLGDDASECGDTMSTASGGAGTLKDAINNVKDSIGNFDSNTTVFLGAVGAFVGALASIVTEVVGIGDEIDKTSQKLGFTTEGYQTWSYTLGLNGTDVTALKGAMKSLRAEVNKDNTAFEKLGLNMSDIKTMTDEELFATTVEALQGVADQGERSALAYELLGTKASEFMPLLNSSTDSIKEAKERLYQLNGVMSDNLVSKSASVTDAMTNLDVAFKGLKYVVAETVLELIPLDDILNAVATDIANMGKYASLSDERIATQGKSVEELTAELKSAKEEYDALMSDPTEVLASQERIQELQANIVVLQEAIENLSGAVEDNSEAEKRAAAEAEAHAEAVASAVTTYAETYESYKAVAEGMVGTFDKAPKATKKSIREMKSAMESQIKWNQQYSQNLQTITESNIEGVSELATEFANMGAEGADYAKTLADAINKGDNKKVEELVTTYQELQSSQETLAGSMTDASGAFDDLYDTAHGDIEQIKTELNELDGTTVYTWVMEKHIDNGDAIGHAGGLVYVPKNDYSAKLHEGEAVLTKDQADEWRNGKGGNGATVNVYTQSIDQATLDYIFAYVNERGAS